jgi:Tat protein translocase TatB subunit
MFGIGLPEFILILVLVVIVVGPEQLPGVVRRIFIFLREARRHISEIKEAVNREAMAIKEPLGDLADDLQNHEMPPSGRSAQPTNHANEKSGSSS